MASKRVNEDDLLSVKRAFSQRTYAEFLAEAFGNEKGIAEKMAETYHAAPEGSQVRKGVLDSVLNVLCENNRADTLDKLKDEDLLAEARNLLEKLSRDGKGAV